MAGKVPQVLGACRLDTSAGAATVRNQSGMFDSGAWTRLGAGQYRCTLGAGTEAQNALDPNVTQAVAQVEDTRTDRIFATQIVRTSATVIDVTIASITVGGAGVPVCALADPNTGFALLLTHYTATGV